eukprot:Seg95.3 transcript_id=Seg95.3/GoldUCD/mRNA.D3Y31 product="hypothetical protein" protein_id=Seg95.3/GoldUCD/D3Y31
MSGPESNDHVDNTEANEGNSSWCENRREEEEIGHARDQPELVEEADAQLTDEELEIADKLQNNIQSNERERLPSIKKINEKNILAEVQKANEVLNKVKSNDITMKNDLVYAAAVVVTESLGVKI